MATPATFDLLPSHLLSAKDEADAFGRLRRRLVSRLVRQTLSTARFRVSLIVVLTSVLWAGMFWMFLDGFVFLKQTITNEDTYGRIVAGVFELFFAALIVMLVFSSAIILYGSLFRSREITYLMTIPARTGRLFLHKLQRGPAAEQLGVHSFREPHVAGLRHRGRGSLGITTSSCRRS